MKDVSIFGNTFKNVKGFKLPDPQGQEVKFVQTDGTLTVTEAGTYDVSGYESVVVDIESGYISQRDVANSTGVTKVISASESSGGSSDFSTAEVNIVCDDEYVSGMLLAYIENNELLVNNSPDVGSYTVPLFNGTCNIVYTEGGSLSVSGNATVEGLNRIIITGDCTITIENTT